MQVTLAAVADYANKTDTGKLNIMGIFNRINAKTVPALHPHLQIVLVFRFEPVERGQTKHVEIKLVDADGNEKLALATDFTIPRDAPLGTEIHHIITLANLIFERFGDYAFHVLVNEEPKHHLPLTVVQVPPPLQPELPTPPAEP
jgi:hypothetical protein